MQVVSSARPGLSRQPAPAARHLLSLYQECPDAEISLDEFERLAGDRLTVLRLIEQLRAKGLNEGDQEYMSRLKEAEKKHLPLRSAAEARADREGHFILRLAYCRTEDLRHWFLQQECHLLRFRLESMSSADRSEFMAANGIVFRQLEAAEMAEMRDKLVGLARVTDANFSASKFYMCVAASLPALADHPP